MNYSVTNGTSPWNWTTVPTYTWSYGTGPVTITYDTDGTAGVDYKHLSESLEIELSNAKKKIKELEDRVQTLKEDVKRAYNHEDIDTSLLTEFLEEYF